MANSGETYCVPLGNRYTLELHNYWKTKIVPKIQNIHVDLYYRYDSWLLDPNSTLTTKDVDDFADLIIKIQKSYYANDDFYKCIQKISPFENKLWDRSDTKYRNIFPVDPYYEYVFVGALWLKLGAIASALALIYEI